MKLISFLTLTALLSISSCSHFKKSCNKEKASCSKEKCEDKAKKCEGASCDKKEDKKSCHKKS